MKKNFAAFAIGCVFTVVLLLLAEFFFVVNEKNHWIAPVTNRGQSLEFDEDASEALRPLLKNQPAAMWRSNLAAEESDRIKQEGGYLRSNGGYTPCCVYGGPGMVSAKAVVQRFSTITQKLIYTAHYSFDGFGRRATPVSKKPTTNLLMFGDSYILGEAIDDKYAAPYELGLRRPDTQVYNFGLSGGSPNEFLYELQKNPAGRLGGISPLPTTVTFTFMDNHLERLFCRSLCLGPRQNWSIDRPYYTLENDAVTFKGFFQTDRPLINAFYRVVESSALLRFFDIAWPPRFTQRHFDFFAEVMMAAKIEAEKKFNAVDFYVIFYPQFSAAYAQELRDACEKRGLKVLDYSRLNMDSATLGQHEVFGDGHPSPATQFLFAYLLNRDLPQRASDVVLRR